MSVTIDLGGTRAFVTGGTRGIGAEVARTLARAGAFVALGYREDDASAAKLAAVEYAAQAVGARLR